MGLDVTATSDSLENRIQQDIKAAQLAGQTHRLTTLRGLKSAMLYVKVAAGSRDSAMPDADVIQLLSKEAKKRQESADLYVQGGNQERADLELAEKAIIEEYLPKQLSEAELIAVIDTVIAGTDATGPAAMGGVIKAVKERTAGSADGSMIARLVKERLAA